LRHTNERQEFRQEALPGRSRLVPAAREGGAQRHGAGPPTNPGSRGPQGPRGGERVVEDAGLRARAFGAAAALVLAALAACGDSPGTAVPTDGGDPVRGRVLMAQYQCGACHAIPGVPGARGTLGPPLEGFALHSYISGELPNRPDTLRRWIADPAALVPDTAMPDVGASEADAADMAAYLGTLR
jgi:cytochrome c2